MFTSVNRSTNIHNPKRKRGDAERVRAFSLVELIVVMVIIGMLATMVVFRTRSYLIVSKQNAAKMEISRISEALETYYAMSDRYPTNEEGLSMLSKASANFPEGILKKLSVDPWQRDYQYNSPGKDSAYEVICLGADGREGGEGADKDISSEDIDGSSK